jgi:hypothetical protein
LDSEEAAVGPSYTYLGDPHYGEASPGVVLLFW